MGATHVDVTLSALGSDRTEYRGRFLVDTGATDCFVPAAALRAVGIEPVGTRRYELADRSLHDYPYGFVRIELMDEITVGRVIFGPDDAEPLLGVTALESTGFAVDPVSCALKKLPAIRLK